MDGNDDDTMSIDWSSFIIENAENKDNGDQGDMFRICDEDEMYAFLGLEDEDEEMNRTHPEPSNFASHFTSESNRFDPSDLDAVMSVDDENAEMVNILHDVDHPDLKLGTLYPPMREFRLAVRQYAINEEFELGITKSDRNRYRVYYKGNDCTCPWKLNGSTRPNSSVMVLTFSSVSLQLYNLVNIIWCYLHRFFVLKVTVLVNEHKCSSSSRISYGNANKAWVAQKVLPLLRNEPSLGAKALQKRLQDTYNCRVSYDVTWKGMQEALKEMYGNWDESFSMLYRWKEEILIKAPNSVVEIDTQVVDKKVHFHRFFCALEPCIQGFFAACRPYLSVDSTALNGRWNGHLATATALDGHNWMYPVAFGFMDSESKDNWLWFMTQLRRAIGNMEKLAICTDVGKGLMTAVELVFPQADKRECFRHLMQNFIKRFHENSYRGMYPAARAYRQAEFDRHIGPILHSDPEVITWLNRDHKFKWMRSTFDPDIKCDYINNNLAECFNNWVKDHKDLPVVQLADKIRELIMVFWEKRRRIGGKLCGTILPAIVHQLNIRSRGLGHLKVVNAGNGHAEVFDNSPKQDRHIVDLGAKECSCLEWQHTGTPCDHAIVVITSFRIERIENYVHDYYSVQKFREAYRRVIYPIRDRSQWPQFDMDPVVKGPLAKQGVGRQRKLRIKGCLEGGSKSKTTTKEGGRQMKRGPIRCKKCGELGHRQTSYKCPLNGTKKRNRKQRSRKYAGANEPSQTDIQSQKSIYDRYISLTTSFLHMSSYNY
jgi:hypothetical protein